MAAPAVSRHSGRSSPPPAQRACRPGPCTSPESCAAHRGEVLRLTLMPHTRRLLRGTVLIGQQQVNQEVLLAGLRKLGTSAGQLACQPPPAQPCPHSCRAAKRQHGVRSPDGCCTVDTAAGSCAAAAGTTASTPSSPRSSSTPPSSPSCGSACSRLCLSLGKSTLGRRPMQLRPAVQAAAGRSQLTPAVPVDPPTACVDILRKLRLAADWCADGERLVHRAEAGQGERTWGTASSRTHCARRCLASSSRSFASASGSSAAHRRRLSRAAPSGCEDREWPPCAGPAWQHVLRASETRGSATTERWAVAGVDC